MEIVFLFCNAAMALSLHLFFFFFPPLQTNSTYISKVHHADTLNLKIIQFFPITFQQKIKPSAPGKQ